MYGSGGLTRFKNILWIGAERYKGEPDCERNERLSARFSGIEQELSTVKARTTRSAHTPVADAMRCQRVPCLMRPTRESRGTGVENCIAESRRTAYRLFLERCRSAASS